MYDLFNLELGLIENNVSQGDDVFLHGFSLPNGFSIEQFSQKLFAEGIRKEKGLSILSTIALTPKNRPLTQNITQYYFGGKYKVILKIPEEIENLFLGQCQQVFGSTGNQDRKNSILDFLRLSAIPPEFIVGIAYTKQDQYNPGEIAEYEFIQNPNYYDYLPNKAQNSQILANKFKMAVDSVPERNLIGYIMTGNKNFGGEDITRTINYMYPSSFEMFKPFLDQREDYDKQHNNYQPLNIRPRHSDDMLPSR